MRTYAKTVNSSEKIILQIREQRVGIFSPERPKKRLFSDQSSFFESAQAEPDNDRWTGIASDSCTHCTTKSVTTLFRGRRKHGYTTHVFRAKTFRLHSNLEAVTGNDLRVNPSRSIVPVFMQ